MTNEERANKIVNRTVSKEDASGWSKIANRDVLVDDIAEALTLAEERGIDIGLEMAAQISDKNLACPPQVSDDIRKLKNRKEGE